MGQALYRTYRPKKLSEIVGQEHITTALARALKKGTISHAYLFTGPRGTGKTSIARILAHEINNLPYTEDRPHLDIIEIDAASNRRIDEIRDLRDKVHVAPSNAKYKVYIIDEVHMLTKEAFNALLKTLEEPPAHVVFMLATTEAHKLPETIISRTQRFSLKPVELDKVVAHLRTIADKEGIEIDDDALQLVAAHGEGSFRDSISLLDQARHTGDQISLADVQAILGIAPEELITSVLDALDSHNAVAVTKQLLAMREQGFEPAQIARQLGQAIRERIVAGTVSLPHDASMQLLAALVQVPASHDPSTSLEIALLDAALGPIAVKPIMAAHTAHVVASMPTTRQPETLKAPAHKSIRQLAAERAEEAQDATSPSSQLMLDQQSWATILTQLKEKSPTLHTAAKFATPSFTPGVATLHFGYGFHQKRLNDKRNRDTLSKVIASVVGDDILVRCVVDEDAAIPISESNETVHPVAQAASEADIPRQPHQTTVAPVVATTAVPGVTTVGVTNVTTTKPEPAQHSNEAVAAISNIFGGAEVLES